MPGRISSVPLLLLTDFCFVFVFGFLLLRQTKAAFVGFVKKK